jgi:PAS domain S-box-containing protein
MSSAPSNDEPPSTASSASKTEAELRASGERYRTLFEAIDVGFCIIEMLFDADRKPVDYRFLEANPAFERHTGLVNALGRTARELVPDLDEFWFRTYGHVALTGEAMRFENHAPAMHRWFDVYTLRVGPPEEHKVGIVFTDITARKQAQEARRQSEEELRDTKTHLESALLAGNIATWTFDIVQNRVVADDNMARLFSVSPEAAAGGQLEVYLQAIHPDDRAQVTTIIEEAISYLEAYEAEYRVVLPDGSHRWLVARGKVDRDTNGKALALPGVVLDITPQKESASRERSRLTDIFMRAPAFMATLRGPQHIFDLANPTYLQLVGHRDIIGKSVAEALPEVVEQGYIQLLDQVYQTGEAFIGKDVRILLQTQPSAPLEEHFLDFTYQPLYNEEGTVSGILVHGIDLTERKHLEQERERLLVETRIHAEREELLNQIGAAVRTTLDPNEIMQSVTVALGEALDVDRCYFVRYDQKRDTAHVTLEWYRPGIEPLTGITFQMSAYSVDRDDNYRAGNTHVVNDVVAYAPEDATPLLALNARALVRVPLVFGNEMTALGVMTSVPRVWSDDDIRLIENVATLVRSALEFAHVQQRERNIAQQLQAALQPAPAPDLPGFSLKSFYRPALAEASVGGDFFDVFPIEKGCTAIVVGDLSGKGLSAASEVATVRNMVRYGLYSSRTLMEAITNLDRILVEHDLLTGFATLFVGMYDQAQRTLTYVNCGQEPGLIWRAATGSVDQLPPTGPVLGGFMGGSFTEAVVHLSHGDILAIFSDGLTDIGPDRRHMLGIAGVAELLAKCCTNLQKDGSLNASSVLSELVAGVDRHGQFSTTATRDDIALLVGIVGRSNGDDSTQSLP